MMNIQRRTVSLQRYHDRAVQAYYDRPFPGHGATLRYADNGLDSVNYVRVKVNGQNSKGRSSDRRRNDSRWGIRSGSKGRRDNNGKDWNGSRMKTSRRNCRIGIGEATTGVPINSRNKTCRGDNNTQINMRMSIGRSSGRIINSFRLLNGDTRNGERVCK